MSSLLSGNNLADYYCCMQMQIYLQKSIPSPDHVEAQVHCVGFGAKRSEKVVRHP